MLARRKVYICDHCGRVELPRRADVCGVYGDEMLPNGWGDFGSSHLCSDCYYKWKRLEVE